MTDQHATRTVETSAELGVAPERAIQAFLRDEDLRGWWRVSRSLVEARTGGAWAAAWDGYGDPPADHMWAGTIRELEDARLVIAPMVQNEPNRPLFGPFQLEVFAEPAAEGCRLTVLHHGYQHGEHWDWLHEAVVTGWVSVLAEMKEWLESGA